MAWAQYYQPPTYHQPAPTFNYPPSVPNSMRFPTAPPNYQPPPSMGGNFPTYDRLRVAGCLLMNQAMMEQTAVCVPCVVAIRLMDLQVPFAGFCSAARKCETGVLVVRAARGVARSWLHRSCRLPRLRRSAQQGKDARNPQLAAKLSALWDFRFSPHAVYIMRPASIRVCS
jgi:hypothetical protein